jgi:hypothetical protein
MKRVLTFGIAAALLVSACGDDGPLMAGEPDPSYIGRAVDSGFRPELDGFAFPNFDHVTYPERFTIEDLLDRFGGGPRLCRDGVLDPCIPTDEAQIFIDTVERSRRAGHCEGMVLLAAARHHWGLAPETASLPPDDWVIDAIIFGFATIFLPEVQAEVRAWESASLTDTVALLAVELDAGRLDYGMGLYTDLGGHEVLPYAIEYPSEGHARVLVYDPNWPLVERHVDIDLVTETWRFSFTGDDPDADPSAWTGDATMLDLNSIPLRAAALEARGVDITPPGA